MQANALNYRLSKNDIRSAVLPNQTPRVLIASDATPGRNGVGVYYGDLYQHLRHQLPNISLLAPQHSDNVCRSWSVAMPGDKTQRLHIPSLRELVSTIRTKRPDVVIAATPGPYGLIAAQTGLRNGAHVIVGFHTSYEQLSDLYWSHVGGKVVKRYFQLFNGMLFRRAESVIVNSESMVTLAEQIGAQKTQLVGTPLGYDFIRTPIKAPPPTVSSILFAGRLAAEKNIDAVIAAAAALPAIRFDIAGDGPDADKVKQAAATLPNFNHLGWLGRDQLLAQLDRHDMLVLPSKVESFGTVALEAMARQRCALVSAECGITQWPELKKGLFQIRPNETLTTAIERIATMPAHQRREIVARGRQAALDLNQWNIDLWLDIIAPNRQPKPNH